VTRLTNAGAGVIATTATGRSVFAKRAVLATIAADAQDDEAHDRRGLRRLREQTQHDRPEGQHRQFAENGSRTWLPEHQIAFLSNGEDLQRPSQHQQDERGGIALPKKYFPRCVLLDIAAFHQHLCAVGRKPMEKRKADNQLCVILIHREN